MHVLSAPRGSVSTTRRAETPWWSADHATCCTAWWASMPCALLSITAMRARVCVFVCSSCTCCLSAPTREHVHHQARRDAEVECRPRDALHGVVGASRMGELTLRMMPLLGFAPSRGSAAAAAASRTWVSAMAPRLGRVRACDEERTGGHATALAVEDARTHDGNEACARRERMAAVPDGTRAQATR